MVVVDRLREKDLARTIIMSLDVSEDVLDECEHRNPDGVDWLGVVYALDRVFLSHGGSLGQYTFLMRPSSVLNGRAPIDVLPLNGGPIAVCEAASHFATSGA